MYLLNYDFYDIHGLFVFLRFKPPSEKYFSAITELKKYIDEDTKENSIDSNIVRKILRPYFNDSPSWIFTDNEYTANIFIIKDKAKYDILSEIFAEFEKIHVNDGERFYLLCDCVHNIPLLLADTKNPAKALMKMTEPYRKKYHPKFLSEEIKKLR